MPVKWSRKQEVGFPRGEITFSTNHTKEHPREKSGTRRSVFLAEANRHTGRESKKTARNSTDLEFGLAVNWPETIER